MSRPLQADAAKPDSSSEPSLERQDLLSTEALAVAFERAPVGLAITNPIATILHANTAFAEILGYSVDEVRGKTLAELDHPEDLERSRTHIERMNRGDVDYYERTKRYIRKDGRVVWVHLRVTWLFSRADGRYLIQATDITAEKKSQDALSASEERFRQMTEAIDQVFWIYNLHPFCLLYSSPAAVRIWGFDPMMDQGDTSGRHAERMFAALHPEDLPIFMELFGDTLDTAREREYRLVRADGDIRWVRVRAFPIHDAAGKPHRVAGTTEDITERKQTELQLERYHKLKNLITQFSTEFVNLSVERLDQSFVAALAGLSEVARAATAGIWLFDATGSDLQLSWHWIRPDLGEPRFTRLPLARLSVPPQLEQGNAVAQSIAGLPDQLAAQRNALAEQGFQSILCAPLIAGGGLFGVLAFASTEDRTWSKEMSSLMCIAAGMFANVIERIRADESTRSHRDQLAHVLRLKTMGQLASGIAHELNQPLSAILSYARGCVRRIASGSADLGEIQGALEKIGDQAVRAADVIRMLRAVVKADSHRKRHDLRELTREALKLAQPDLNASGVRLTFAATDVPDVQVDTIQIQQVLLNLIRNACDALARVPSEQREIRIESTLRNPKLVEVLVHDNGPGISPAHAEKIFDEFFTTQPEGLGLGLPISRSIVEAHGGRLWLDTSMVPGACFRFTLPVSSE